nr:hypothetical protein [Tanacetum cinerariifolium]
MLKNFNKEDLEVLWSIVKARFEKNIVYYLLVEMMYPLTRNTLHHMWNDVRLQVDYEVEMAYDFLRLPAVGDGPLVGPDKKRVAAVGPHTQAARP